MSFFRCHRSLLLLVTIKVVWLARLSSGSYTIRRMCIRKRPNPHYFKILVRKTLQKQHLFRVCIPWRAGLIFSKGIEGFYDPFFHSKNIEVLFDQIKLSITFLAMNIK